MGVGQLVDRGRGIARSLLIYYGQPGKRRALRRFYASLIAPGDLCFDLGAHVGNRVGAWLDLGAAVVAVEPHPDFQRILRRLYGRRPGFTLEACAVSDRAGTAQLLGSSLTPTCSSLSPEWTRDVATDPRFGAIEWDQRVPTPVTTLDRLIVRHGEPAFCKIDVEGLEPEVLAGLGQPLRALSFEFIPVVARAAIRCVELTRRLGDYEYRWSQRETLRWGCPEWLPADAMCRALAELPMSAPSGDIYARLRQ